MSEFDNADINQERDFARKRVHSLRKAGATQDRLNRARMYQHVVEALAEYKDPNRNLSDTPGKMSESRLIAQIGALTGSPNPDDQKRLRALLREVQKRGVTVPGLEVTPGKAPAA